LSFQGDILDLHESCKNCGGGGKVKDADHPDGFADCEKCKGRGTVWSPMGDLLERFVVAMESIAQDLKYRRK
jgi:DnaJ-class molecular chaperone